MVRTTTDDNEKDGDCVAVNKVSSQESSLKTLHKDYRSTRLSRLVLFVVEGKYLQIMVVAR